MTRRWVSSLPGLAALGLAAATCVGHPNVGFRAPADALRHPDAAFWTERVPDTVDLRFETTKGVFVLRTFRNWAPIGVDRFVHLVQAGYYDDSRFSRSVPNFIAQFGIAGVPAITSIWKDRRILDDSVRASNLRGTFGFAMTAPNTRTTQIYISRIDQQRLDAQGFSPLGRVIQGMSVVDSLYDGYGESSGGGMRAGHQGEALAGGNAYFDKNFPRLDHLIRARVIRTSRQP